MGSIIDRYILKSFVVYFLGALALFSILFCVVDLMSNLARYEVPGSLILKYYGYYIFEIAYQMLPVACLVGTIFTLTTMSRNLELTALFSMGMSFFRVTAPILAAVLLISGVGFFLSDRALPQLIKERSYLYYTEILKRPDLYSTVKADRIWFRSRNMIFNLQSIQAAKGQASGLTLYFFDPEFQLSEMITAEDVTMSEGGGWVLGSGQVTLLGEEHQAPRTQAFERKTLTMPHEFADLSETSTPSESLSLGELGRYIERNKAAGLDTLHYEVDYHSKWGFALAAFVMSVIGLPFTVSQQRSGGRTLALGMCIGLAFGYWVLFSSGQSLGRHGVLPPVAAAWLPNFLMLALSVVLFRRLRK